jgi:2-haloacid dehalogenase
MIDALCDRGHTPYLHRAVSYVMDRCGISYTQEEVSWLVSEIEKLKPFPDVIADLEKLRSAG